MNSKERFFATVERKPVDNPACWLGIPDQTSLNGLFAHFNVSNINELKLKLDDDIWPVELPYHSPVSNAIYMAFDFSSKPNTSSERTLTGSGIIGDSYLFFYRNNRGQLPIFLYTQ